MYEICYCHPRWKTFWPSTLGDKFQRRHLSRISAEREADPAHEPYCGPAMDARSDGGNGRWTRCWRRSDACGVGFGGPVDFNAQKVITSTHVGGWEGFDLVHEVVSRFRVPAIMDRDSMAGALGEGRYGAKHATSRQGVCEQCARSLSFALRILTQEAALLGSAAV